MLKRKEEHLPVNKIRDGLHEALAHATENGVATREQIMRAFIAGVRLGSSAGFDHARQTAQLFQGKADNAIGMAEAEIETFIGETRARLDKETLPDAQEFAKRFGVGEPSLKPVKMVKPAPVKMATPNDEKLTKLVEGLNRKSEAV